MAKYVKTVPIEAEQFDGSDEMIDKYSIYRPVMPGAGHFGISTLEGEMDLYTGDWIATGVNGEHWAIKDDVFKKTYRPEQTSQSTSFRVGPRWLKLGDRLINANEVIDFVKIDDKNVQMNLKGRGENIKANFDQIVEAFKN